MQFPLLLLCLTGMAYAFIKPTAGASITACDNNLDHIGIHCLAGPPSTTLAASLLPRTLSLSTNTQLPTMDVQLGNACGGDIYQLAPGTPAPDWNLPCNAAMSVADKCSGGNGSATYDNGPGSIQGTDDAHAPSNQQQRDCACESQWFDLMAGCNACYLAHGAPRAPELEASVLSSISSTYCAATYRPTNPLAVYFYGNLVGSNPNPMTANIDTSDLFSTPSVTYSDPLSGSTAVSLYFTPAVTGSAALTTPVVTGKSVSTNIVSGQIVAITPGAASSGSGSGASSTATTTTKSSDGGRCERSSIGAVVALGVLLAML